VLDWHGYALVQAALYEAGDNKITRLNT
jgi:hypothetical protein